MKTSTDYKKAILVRCSISEGNEELMYNVDNGKKKCCGYLGHANDMTFLEAGKTDYLYVVTKKESNYGLIKLAITDNTYKKVGEYNFKLNGTPRGIAGIDIMKSDSTTINFLLKSGNDFYTAKLKKSATKGTINLTKYFTINVKEANVNGKICDLSSYKPQGFCYSKNKIYVPLTKGNVSYVLTYENIDNVKNDPEDPLKSGTDSFRITSKKYSKLFEIESVAIQNKKLYFSYNSKKEGAAVQDFDAVAYFKGFEEK